MAKKKKKLTAEPPAQVNSTEDLLPGLLTEIDVLASKGCNVQALRKQAEIVRAHRDLAAACLKPRDANAAKVHAACAVRELEHLADKVADAKAGVDQ